jgi:mono/diheme cytochrome c family protein
MEIVLPFHGGIAMRTSVALGLMLLAALVVGASGDQIPQGEVVRAHVPSEVPDEWKARRNPVEASKESVDLGKLYYSSQCVMCHNSNGDGQGELTLQYHFVTPDFTNRARQESRTDGELFFILSEGHGSMPGQDERFKDEVKWSLVNYVRTLVGEP